MSPAAVAGTPALFGVGEAVPGEAVPGEAVPGEAVPGEAATRQLWADYAVHVARLTINPDAKRLRRRNARALTDMHPDLWAWLDRPTPARLADLRRSHAWPLIC